MSAVCVVKWRKYRLSPDFQNDPVSPIFFFCNKRRRARYLRERIPLNTSQMVENPNYSKEEKKDFITGRSYIVLNWNTEAIFTVFLGVGGGGLLL